MYLYHRAYLPTIVRPIIRKYQPVREGEGEEAPALNWQGYFAILFLIIFVASVGAAGYIDKFRPAIPGPTRYLELRQLPNTTLRERAFAVAVKLRDLSKEYAARQVEINGQYLKDKTEYDKQIEAYKSAQLEYDKNKTSCATYPYSTTLGSLSSPSCITVTGVSVTPPVPPTEPSFPVVTVEPEWAAKAEKVEEEAAAVYEEIFHRLGTYLTIFEVPQNYNPGTPPLSDWASTLKIARIGCIELYTSRGPPQPEYSGRR